MNYPLWAFFQGLKTPWAPFGAGRRKALEQDVIRAYGLRGREQRYAAPRAPTSFRDIAQSLVTNAAAVGLAYGLGGAPAASVAAMARGVHKISSGAATISAPRNMAELLDHALAGTLESKVRADKFSELTRLALQRVFGTTDVYSVWRDHGYEAIERLHDYYANKNLSAAQRIDEHWRDSALRDLSFVALNQWAATRLHPIFGGAHRRNERYSTLAYGDPALSNRIAAQLHLDEYRFFNGIRAALMRADYSYAGHMTDLITGFLTLGIGAWALNKAVADHFNNVSAALREKIASGGQLPVNVTLDAETGQFMVNAKVAIRGDEVAPIPRDPEVSALASQGMWHNVPLNNPNALGIAVKELYLKGWTAPAITSVLVKSAGIPQETLKQFFDGLATAASDPGHAAPWALVALPFMMDWCPPQHGGVDFPPEREALGEGLLGTRRAKRARRSLAPGSGGEAELVEEPPSGAEMATAEDRLRAVQQTENWARHTPSLQRARDAASRGGRRRRRLVGAAVDEVGEAEVEGEIPSEGQVPLTAESQGLFGPRALRTFRPADWDRSGLAEFAPERIGTWPARAYPISPGQVHTPEQANAVGAPAPVSSSVPPQNDLFQVLSHSDILYNKNARGSIGRALDEINKVRKERGSPPIGFDELGLSHLKGAYTNFEEALGENYEHLQKVVDHLASLDLEGREHIHSALLEGVLHHHASNEKNRILLASNFQCLAAHEDESKRISFEHGALRGAQAAGEQNVESLLRQSREEMGHAIRSIRQYAPHEHVQRHMIGYLRTHYR